MCMKSIFHSSVSPSNYHLTWWRKMNTWIFSITFKWKLRYPRIPYFTPEQSVGFRDWGNVINGHVLRPVWQAGVKSGRRTVWEKETVCFKETVSKKLFQRWDRGTQALLGPEPCSSEPHHCYLVSWQQKASSVLQWSQPPVSLVTSPILLITLNTLCYFLVQGLSPSWRS